MRFVTLLLVSTALLAPAPSGAQKRFCPKPPPSPYKHSGVIVTSMDRAVGGMRTTLVHPRKLTCPGGSYYFAATFLHTDPRLGVKPTVDLVFSGQSSAGAGHPAGGVTFFADGLSLDTDRSAAFQTQPAKRGTLKTSARVTLSLAEVTKLAEARRVSVRVGASELLLTDNHLEALRELLSQASPARSGWATAADVPVGH